MGHTNCFTVFQPDRQISISLLALFILVYSTPGQIQIRKIVSVFIWPQILKNIFELLGHVKSSLSYFVALGLTWGHYHSYHKKSLLQYNSNCKQRNLRMHSLQRGTSYADDNADRVELDRGAKYAY